MFLCIKVNGTSYKNTEVPIHKEYLLSNSNCSDYNAPQAALSGSGTLIQVCLRFTSPAKASSTEKLSSRNREHLTHQPKDCKFHLLTLVLSTTQRYILYILHNLLNPIPLRSSKSHWFLQGFFQKVKPSPTSPQVWHRHSAILNCTQTRPGSSVSLARA